MVEGYVRRILHDIEHWEVDRCAPTAPITRDRVILEERDEEEGDDPGNQDSDHSVSQTSKARCGEDPLIE